MPRKTYKDMTLTELEAKAAEREAVSQRLPAALKTALREAREAIAQDPAGQTPAPAPDPQPTPEETAPAASEESAGLTPDAPDVSDKLAEAVVDVGPRPVLTTENELCGGCEKTRSECGGHEVTDEMVAAAEADDDDSGYHEACELDADEIAARAASRREAFAKRVQEMVTQGMTMIDAEPLLAAEFPGELAAYQAAHPTVPAARGEFTKRVAQLMDGGFTDTQAVEALAGEFPDEAAAYTAMPDPAARPGRDESDIDKSTGEVLSSDGKPFARVEATPYPVTFYRPVLKVIVPDPDDPTKETVEELTCEHVAKYGHGSEKAALQCARSMAYQRGLRIA